MIYIYDILLNFSDNDLIYDFYEWHNSDNIENIKRIKLIHINSQVFDDLLNYECKLEMLSLIKIYRTCEIYQSKGIKVLDYALLVSDGFRVLAIELDKDGNIIYKSKLLLDEEDEISNLANNLEETNLIYTKKKRIVTNRFLTRKELIIKNYLYHEIEDSYKNKKYAKLRFIYEELFDKEISSYKAIKDELISSIEDINNRHKELFNLLKLSPKKKQV